jgi:putative acetyltransferase
MDFQDVLSVEREAFGEDDEANLVAKLLDDQTAKPILSLLAIDKGKAIGHILFTRGQLEPTVDVNISILGPLAVIPSEQRKGVGGELIKHGLKMLAESGVDLVFVLGHPEYYPRHGFVQAGKHCFDAPYPILEKNSDAWMVQALREGVMDRISGRVICSDTFNEPEYWSE